MLRHSAVAAAAWEPLAVYADKGYVARWLVDLLRARQMDFITKVRKNMKPVQHTPFDEAVLKRRSLVETVFDALKNLCKIAHTRALTLPG